MKACAVLLAVLLSACHSNTQADKQLHGKRPAKEMREAWEADRKKEATHFTDADLQRMVGKLFTEDDPDRANYRGLLGAGKRAVPFLISAL